MARRRHVRMALWLALVAVLIVALNAPTLFSKPSHELSIGVSNGEGLKLAQAEVPFAASEIVDIKQGEASTILLTKAGKVYALGDNMYGQLGNGSFGTPTAEFHGVALPADIKISKIDMTHKHALALTDDGDVWAWGMNASGQLGNGSREDGSRPAKVFSGASDIAAGYRFSATIRDGELWAWGMQCDPATPGLAELTALFAQDISVGGSYYDGVAQNDAVYCLEQENLPINSTKPRKMDAVEPARYVSVTGGYGHILLLDDKQTAWGIGCNAWGQLGRGNAQNDGPARKIRKVAFPAGTKIAELDAGFRHSAARDTDGSVWTWGHDMHGDAVTYKSNKADKPKRTELPGKALHVAAGHEVTGAITADGFYAAGENQQGQIDTRAADDKKFFLPKFQKMNGQGDEANTFSLGMLRQYYWQSDEVTYGDQ